MTSLPPIDRDTALRLLEKQVRAAGPDYVYMSGAEGCLYVKGDAPSCLIGRALHDYGVPLDELRTWDEQPDGDITSIADNLAPPYLPFTVASTVLAAAQRAQDNGESWDAVLVLARAAPLTAPGTGGQVMTPTLTLQSGDKFWLEG